MKNQPSVDVIIPTYNGLPYLKETIDSVLGQTYQNFNLLIVDDGSTDSGATERYVKNLADPRVKYVRKPNGGQATARNYGIKHTSAPFVTFLDSDDLWYPDKLQSQINKFNKHPEYGMVYGYHILINEHEKTVGLIKYGREGWLFNYLLGGNWISGSASMVMVRREVFEDVGVFHEDFLIGEDWEMWLRIAQKYQIGCVHKVIASLRQLPEGMQKNYIKMADGLTYMLPIMLKEFKPSLRGRAKLIGACLYDASVYYFLGGQRAKARRALLKVMFAKPSQVRVRKDLLIIYARILFGWEIVRILRRYATPSYRAREAEYKKKLEAGKQ